MIGDVSRECNSLELTRRVNELYHDLQSEEFDAIHRWRHRVEKEFWESEVAPRIAGTSAGIGVDLCTGTGFVPRALLPRLGPKVRMVCTDISDGALERTRSSLGEQRAQVDFIKADAAAVPLPAASADWVSLNAALHHVPDASAVLKEVDRLLKPGGRFCLGYEPNAAFFRSRFVSGMERLIWHAFWYLAPAQNIRRLRRVLGLRTQVLGAEHHLEQINAALLTEGRIRRPMSLQELTEMVDLHASREGHEEVGFEPDSLLRSFPGYAVECLLLTDYGGDMLRRHRWMRSAYDALMRRVCPAKGRLFSWILRKPHDAA